MISKDRLDALLKLKSIEKSVYGSSIVPVFDERLDLRAKLEFQLLGGSTKVRPAYRILKDYIVSGKIKENTSIVESSSGNFAIAMAMLCRIAGVNFIPVVDLNTNVNTIKFLEFFCKEVVVIDKIDENGGYLLNRLRYIEEAVQFNSNLLWPKQYSNLNNYFAHYETTGQEIIEAFPDVEYVFIAAGTCGSLSGISSALKEYDSSIQIIAVDIEGSVIFGGEPKRRYIPGMGASVTPGLLKYAQYDEVVYVDEADVPQGCYDLFDKGFIFAGGSSGTVYHAIQEYFKNKILTTKPKVLFVCPDGGRYYIDTIYNNNWVKETFQ